MYERRPFAIGKGMGEDGPPGWLLQGSPFPPAARSPCIRCSVLLARGCPESRFQGGSRVFSLHFWGLLPWGLRACSGKGVEEGQMVRVRAMASGVRVLEKVSVGPREAGGRSSYTFTHSFPGALEGTVILRAGCCPTEPHPPKEHGPARGQTPRPKKMTLFLRGVLSEPSCMPRCQGQR